MRHGMTTTPPQVLREITLKPCFASCIRDTGGLEIEATVSKVALSFEKAITHRVLVKLEAICEEDASIRPKKIGRIA